MDHDTKALLLECGAGVQMAVGAIDDVLGQTRDKKLEQALLSLPRGAQSPWAADKGAFRCRAHPGKRARTRWRAGCPGSRRARSLPSLPPTRRSRTLSPTAATWASSPSSATATATRARAKPPVKSRASSSTRADALQVHAGLSLICTIFLARRQKIFHCAFFLRGV